jgi:uncharacterized LabA/DUF88 family protein
VTTQNIHPEHSDVEESVVKHEPVSEIEASPPSPTPEASATNESVSPAGMQNVLQEEHSSKPTHISQQDQTAANSATTEPDTFFAASSAQTTPEPIAEPIETSLANSQVKEEEIRPFTAYIEEFQQTETRLGSSLTEYASNSFTRLPAPDEQQEEKPASRGESEETQPSTTGETETPEREAPTSVPAARPVSPLLRPATPRTRSRHGNARQREGAPVVKEEPIQKAVEPQKTETAPSAPVVTEPAPHAVEEQPRPARRYRFDRPAVPAATAPASTQFTQVRAEENKEIPGSSIAVPTGRTENGQASNGQRGEKEAPPVQQAKQATQATQPPEKAATKQVEIQEAPAELGGTTPATAAVPEHARGRRHAQERQRAKAQASTPAPVPTAPVAEIAAEVIVAEVPPKEEEHPEELPPLEYSELQKANSRRRRRRHSNNAASPAGPANVAPLPAVVKPVTAETSVTPISPVVIPRTPIPAPTSQVTITSGYTVGQMNQGREGTSPFMGPEPSPARGTMAAQNVRSIRTDAQRTPVYPVRTTEASSASVHQLANVVAQAIQTQTDRMVAELRRANQSPTNVSVSLPPFPSTERVGVFVDVANLLYSARTLRMTVDFGKLLDFLRGNRRLIRAHAYCPTSPQPGDEQMFLQAVKGLGYRITTKNYKTFSSGAKKADLDLDLCMDVVRLVDGRAVDCIVLVSGDSDFMPMLDYCSDHGVRVEVAAFDEAMSATLRQSCDLFINLSMLEEIRA